MARVSNDFPEDFREQPLQVKVAVLAEQVKNLKEEVRGLRRALWSFVFSVLGGAVLFLLSIASGWIGPKATASIAVGREVAKWFGLG